MALLNLLGANRSPLRMRVLRRRNQLGILLERLWQRAGAQTVPSTTTINVWPGML